MIKNNKFNTKPILIHAPGKIEFNPLWKTLAQHTNTVLSIKPENLSIITWNSGEPNANLISRERNLGWFEKSLSSFGVEFTVLGSNIGDKWVNSMKIDLTIDHLEKETGQFVLAGDSSDVLLIRSLENICVLFESFACDLLFNAEINFWPILPEVKAYEDSIGFTEFRYLNAGLWIGKRDFCLEFFKCAKKHLIDNSEQRGIKLAYQEYRQNVKIDQECKIFQNINRVGKDENCSFCSYSIEQ